MTHVLCADVRVALIGAGGHARVLLDAARAEGRLFVEVVLDARPELRGRTFEGLPIAGDESELRRLASEGVEGVVLGVGSVDAGTRRQVLYERIAAYGLAFPSVRHPAAVVASSAAVGAATVIFAAAVVNPGATLGLNVIVNTAAVVEHDVSIGDHTHISPGARIAGGVRVGTMSHLGLGCVVLQGVRIGDRALVAAGAVVTGDVPDDGRVAGVPARAMAASD